MKYSTWEKKYVPVCDVEVVPSDVDSDRVWTLISCDGQREVLSGEHYVNKLHFIITEKPYKGKDMEVIKDTTKFYPLT